MLRLLTLCLGLAMSLAAPARAADKVVLMLNWYVYGEHAPFYLGKERGFYAAEGIDLDIQEGRGSAVTTQAVAAGSATFGYVDVPTMMRAAIRGAPVTAVGVLVQVNPMSVMGLEEKHIRTPEDIKGRIVAVTPGDSMSQIWPLFLRKTGLKDTDFQVVSGDGQTKLNAVINGRADLLLGYVMDQSMKIKDATGKDVFPIKFADYGINLISSGIITRTPLLTENPDLVRRFMRASTKAVEAAEKGPEGRRRRHPGRPAQRRPARHLAARVRADHAAVSPARPDQRPVSRQRSTHAGQRGPDGGVRRPGRCRPRQGRQLLHQRLPALMHVRAPDAMTAAAIALRGVSKIYRTREGDVPSLRPVDLRISPGEVVSVVGPSGCGKSTLLKMVAGLLPPTAGTIEVAGHPVTRPHRDVGIVFQAPLLLPWRSVLGNVMMPVEVKRLPRAPHLDRARALLDMTGLSAFEGKYPWQLSGGMQQRAAICRALVHDPGILLMDEPFGALDALTRETMNLELQRIQMETGKTILLITHSIPEAVFLSDRVVVMTERPGAIAAAYDVPLPRPRSLNVMGGPEFGELTRAIRRHFHAQGHMD